MNNDPTSSLVTSAGTVHDATRTIPQSFLLRYFWAVMACLFPIITAMGFTLDYIMIFSSDIKPHWFAHLHGTIMTGWLFVFLTQTILAAKGNLKFHRQLGTLSVGLGVLVWLSMGIAVVRPMIAFPPPQADGTWDILLIQLYGMALFGLFFTWGILVRKKAAAHKRLLFFATLVLMQAGIDRIGFLPGLGDALYVRFIYLDALMIPLLIYDIFTVRRIHKITMIGGVIIVIIQIGITNTWGSPAWHTFWFNRLAPIVEQVIEVKLSDTQIDPLLGDYGDKNWHMTIFRDDGKIYLKLPDTPNYEIGATSLNEWFLRTMAWRVSFIRGTDGRVIKIINTQPSNRWEAQRLNEN